MSGTTAEQVRSFFLEHLADDLAAVGLSPDVVTDDFDFLAHGLIDSLGLVELIAALEDRFQVEVDLEDLPVEDITVVGPFCRYVERQVGRDRT